MTAPGPYVIAYDVGTSGVKAALVDTMGHIVNSSTHRYRLITHPNGWVDQDLNEMLTVVADSTKQLLSLAGIAAAEVEGIGVTAQMFNLQPVDRDGVPLIPMISWLDARAARTAEDLARRLPIEEQFTQFGSVLTAKDIVPKALWLRDERPDIWRRTWKLLDCKEAVVMYLTGVAVTDDAGASAMRLASVNRDGWNEDACARLNVPVSKLPEIRPATSVAGGLRTGPAERLGLIPGTPVAVGSGDVPATQIGSGATGTGDAQLSLGTSGYWGIVMDKPLPDPGRRLGLLAHIEPELWILGSRSRRPVGRSHGSFGSWARRHRIRSSSIAWSTRQPAIFHSLPRGSAGNAFHSSTTRFGVRSSASLSIMARAIYSERSWRGWRSRFRDAFEYGLAFGSPVRSIRCVGGAAVGDTWTQIVADVLGRPILSVRDPQDAGARGAAACALVALGRHPGIAFLDGSLVVGGNVSSNPSITGALRT